MNALECNNLAILVQPAQAKWTIQKNVMIGEPRKDEKKIVGHQVATEKDEDNKNKLKITTATSLCKGSTKTTTLQQEKMK